MSEYLERSTVIDIAISAEDVHPYKVAGQPETYNDYNQGWSDACGYISELFEAAPTIDVLAVTSDKLVGSGAIELAPMLRGEWIDDDYGFARCSECNWEWDAPEYKTPYCPHCGAKMEDDEPLTPCKQPNWAIQNLRWKRMDSKEAEELEELIPKIAKRVNAENLLTQIAEESAELTQAALKCRRARQTAAKLKQISPTPVIVKEAYKNLEEEIADVELSICVLGETHSPEKIMLYKARRWLERLEAYDREEDGK